MRTRVRFMLIAAALAALAGCGERPQLAEYENGKYSGKTDARPWEGGAFKGDKGAWEQAMRNRVRGQNEYQRVE